MSFFTARGDLGGGVRRAVSSEGPQREPEATERGTQCAYGAPAGHRVEEGRGDGAGGTADRVEDHVSADQSAARVRVWLVTWTACTARSRRITPTTRAQSELRVKAKSTHEAASEQRQGDASGLPGESAVVPAACHGRGQGASDTDQPQRPDRAVGQEIRGLAERQRDAVPQGAEGGEDQETEQGPEPQQSFLCEQGDRGAQELSVAQGCASCADGNNYLTTATSSPIQGSTTQKHLPLRTDGQRDGFTSSAAELFRTRCAPLPD